MAGCLVLIDGRAMDEQNTPTENAPLRKRVKLLEKEARDTRIRMLSLMTLMDQMQDLQKQFSQALLRLTELQEKA